MDMQPGTTVTIASDIVINGVVAFGRGEQVVIEQVAPNPADPTYKYVVTSRSTGQPMQLRDVDVVAAGAQPTAPMQAVQAPPGGMQQQPYPPAQGPSQRGKKGKKPRPVKGQKPVKTGGGGIKVLTVILAILLVGAIVAIVVLVIQNNNKNKESAGTKNGVSVTSTAPAQTATTTPSSDSSSGTTTSDTGASDPKTVQAKADAEARSYTQKYGVQFSARGLRIIGNWARIGVGPTSAVLQSGYTGPGAQPWTNYYHKVNGTWKLVWSGTGEEPGDIPGCPPQLMNY